MLKVAILIVGAVAAAARVLFPPLVLQVGDSTYACAAVVENRQAGCVPDATTIVLHLVVIAGVTLALFFAARYYERSTGRGN